MKHIVVIYGGRTPEHDISVLTGLHCAKHITDDYIVHLVCITKDGRFVLGSPNIDDYISGRCDKRAECYFADGALYRRGIFGKRICGCYCVVNCCHGGAGENGGLSALMDMANIPITSCDCISAHNQQSKLTTRKILTENGFAQPKFCAVSKTDYDNSGKRVLENIKIELPVIIKPDDSGSSIGITVAKTADELLDGLSVAFEMCETAVVEEFITEMKEINIAVMYHNDELIASSPEAVGSEKFFSFDEKYLNGESNFIKKGTGKDDEFVKLHADEIIGLAKRAYQIFGSSGVVRSDFIITDKQTILNENNTVPGFMAYHLWLKSGIPYGVVIDSMIDSAVKKFNAKRALKTEFSSEILSKNRNLVLN